MAPPKILSGGQNFFTGIFCGVCDKYEIWSPVVVEAGTRQVEVTFPDSDRLKQAVSRSLTSVYSTLFLHILTDPYQKVLNSLRGIQRTALGIGHYSTCFYTPHICFFPNLFFKVDTELTKNRNTAGDTNETRQCVRRTGVNRKFLIKGQSM